MNTTTNTRGVSEAMVAELIAAGDFLAMNGTDGMVRRWEKAKAALEAALAAQGQGDAATLYVEARQCEDCTHIGINDASEIASACGDCEWQGPTPAEDKCPGCNSENCMAVACPICGGRYRFLVDRRLPASASAQGQGEAVAFITHSADALSRLEMTEAGLHLGVGKHACYTHPAPAASPAGVPDGDRVDWMEANARSVSFGKAPGQGYWVHVQGIGYSGGSNRSLRDAIDAARQAQAADLAAAPSAPEGDGGEG